jgi:hypothetical protein
MITIRNGGEILTDPPPAFRVSGVVSSSSTPSAASSSISVVAVPLEVTGDGPTMSLGLGATAGESPPSIELGRRLLSSAEFRADLIKNISIAKRFQVPEGRHTLTGTGKHVEGLGNLAIERTRYKVTTPTSCSRAR